MQPINVHTSQRLSLTLDSKLLWFSNSFETQATLYTGFYRSSVGLLRTNSSVFIGSNAIAF